MVLFRFVMEILKDSEFFSNKMNLRTRESGNLMPFFIFAYWNRENKTYQIIVSPKIVHDWVPIR